MGFLKSFLPPKSFLKCSFLIVYTKTIHHTNFRVGSKFAKHLQHFGSINRLLKQIWPVRIFLKCPFLIVCTKTILHTNFRVGSKFAEHLQHFPIFQCSYRKSSQEPAFKKQVSYDVTGIPVHRWVQTLVSQNAKGTPPQSLDYRLLPCQPF